MVFCLKGGDYIPCTGTQDGQIRTGSMGDLPRPEDIHQPTLEEISAWRVIIHKILRNTSWLQSENISEHFIWKNHGHYLHGPMFYRNWLVQSHSPVSIKRADHVWDVHLFRVMCDERYGVSYMYHRQADCLSNSKGYTIAPQYWSIVTGIHRWSVLDSVTTRDQQWGKRLRSPKPTKVLLITAQSVENLQKPVYSCSGNAYLHEARAHAWNDCYRKLTTNQKTIFHSIIQ